MNITARGLHKKTNTGQVREEVNNILKSLESVILSAHEQRLNNITHELPNNFAISNMSRRDAQCVIYGTIIEDLEKRGFTLSIALNESTTFIKIGWVSMFDRDEMRRMNEIIDKHRVQGKLTE